MTLYFEEQPIAGTVLVQEDIESQNFVMGVSGWRISADGDAEFNDGTFRGQLTANAISGTSIGSSHITGTDFTNGTIEDSPIMLQAAGSGVFVYNSTAGNQDYFTAGTFSFVVPGGVTMLNTVQGWGGGGGGQGSGGAGGGGGEWGKNVNIPVTPGETLTAVVGAGGAAGQGVTGTHNPGSAGGKTQLKRGATVLFEVHGGPGGSGSATLGATGATTAYHFDGGSSSSTGTTKSGGGGGGAGAGFSGTGLAGQPNVGVTHGAGGASTFGGGAGGDGGDGTTSNTSGGSAGVAGAAPGAGGGSGGVGGAFGSAGGVGARGQLQIAWQTGTILETSIAPIAGTDQYGNAYPKGIQSADAVITTLTAASATVTGVLTAANDIYGTFTSTSPGGVAGVVTTAVTFPSTLAGSTFFVFIEPATQVVGGTAILETGAITITNTGFTAAVAWGTTGAVTRTFMYHAHGQ